MDTFKRIVVLGDRMTGKTSYVNEHRKQNSFVIDDVDNINDKMKDFLSDDYEQSILILQYPYNNQQLVNNIDCIVLFNLSELVHNELSEVYNIPPNVIKQVSCLKKYEYIIYDCKQKTILFTA